MLVHKCHTRQHLEHDVPNFILSEHLIFPGSAKERHTRGKKERREEKRDKIRRERDEIGKQPPGCMQPIGLVETVAVLDKHRLS